MSGYKNINDDSGHEAGDIAIVDAATILKKVFGQDKIYRFGGDEFIGIFNETSEIEMNSLFDRFDEEMNLYNKINKMFKVPLHISKGWSSYIAGNDTAYREVFKRADIAMYNDKSVYYNNFRNADRRIRKST